MRYILDTRENLICYATTSVEDVVWPGLLAMVEAAWQADDQGQERMVLNEVWLRRLTSAPTWLACVVCTTAEVPVGYALLWERLLYWHQQPLRAYYLTFLTVSAQHRRRGLARWMLQCLHPLLFEAQQADLVIATFHPERAGLPTVQQTCAQSPGWGFRSFHTASMWGRLLDGQALLPLEVPLSATRVALPAGATCFSPVADEGSVVPPVLPSVASVQDALRARCHVAFGLEASVRTRYFCPDTPCAGTWWYTGARAEDTSCGLSFEMVTVASPLYHLGLVGTIQAVYTQHGTPAHLHQALQHLCEYLQSHGCRFVALLDHQVIPHEVLRQLGFAPTGGTRVFAVWGPRATVEQLPVVQPPYVLDW